MSRRRIWAWRSGGRRRYTLTDAHSEENVALYSQLDARPPSVHKSSNSEDHLLSVGGEVTAAEYEISGRGTWRTLWGEWARDSEDADDEQESQDDGDREEEEEEAMEMMEVEVEEVGLDALTCQESDMSKTDDNLDTKYTIDSNKDVIDLKSGTEVNENILDALNGNGNNHIKVEEDDHLSENSEDYKESFLETKKCNDSRVTLEQEQLLKEQLNDTYAVEKDHESIDDTPVRMYAKQCLDTHAWTSQDLRRFLLCKAKHELGGIPQCNVHGGHEDTNSKETVELQSKPLEPLLDGLLKPFTQYGTIENRINTTNINSGLRKSPERKSLIPLRQLHSSLQKIPNKEISKIKKQTTSFALCVDKRNTFPPRVSGNGKFRGSVDLNYMVHRDISPPPPRARLWSLPTIVVTKERPTNSILLGNACRISSTDTDSDSEAMNFLTVPTLHLPRNKSTGYRKKHVKKKEKQETYQVLENLGQNLSQSCEDLQSPLLELPNILEQKQIQDEGELGSLLSLWSGSWPIPSDSDGTSGSESYAPGSPPPDARQPQTSPVTMEYKDSYMYGRYSANLAEYARQESRRLREDKLKDDNHLFSKELQPYRGRCARAFIAFIRPIWDHTFARIGEDWVFLFVLGTVMAALSFIIDYVILICFGARMYLHVTLGEYHWGLQLFSWVTVPTILVIFSAAFCQWMAPSAAGSGIPEMKTILRGVVLKEYLTWKTLVAKIVGLSAVLGAGLPLGKEGPVMHMASIVATLQAKALRYVKGHTENESRSTDLLAAACTMGVAVCYAAPIGG